CARRVYYYGSAWFAYW
nr:immunoglobulin heavy chain junction region [Mus musculus]NSM04760.1 immunoglobulin heavy chain junction region [Mus musculus]NSM04920.1 immunoglobulin heavy chain junction region [Mus musculus]NSM08079.1 immunoglobulin heavy chain junction region [Mus musculus]